MSLHTALLAEAVFFASFAGVFIILSLGLNLQWGYTGLFNIGVAAFWAIGAYASAIIMVAARERTIIAGHLGLDLHLFVGPGGVATSAAAVCGPWCVDVAFLVAFFAAVGVSALLGLLIALPAVRLRADYLAIATLGLAEIIRIFLVNLEDLSGGTEGIRNIPKPVRFEGGLEAVLLTNTAFMAMVILVVLVVYFLAEYGSRSPYGRVLKAIRDDEDAARALGKNTFRYKVEAFVLGAAIMGAAGSLYAHFLTFVEPLTSFRPFETFLIWAMVIMGGSGNNKGVVLGAILLWGFEFMTLRMEGVMGTIPAVGPWIAANISFLRLLVVGLLVLLLVMFRPQGILGEERVISKVR